MHSLNDGLNGSGLYILGRVESEDEKSVRNVEFWLRGDKTDYLVLRLGRCLASIMLRATTNYLSNEQYLRPQTALRFRCELHAWQYQSWFTWPAYLVSSLININLLSKD